MTYIQLAIPIHAIRLHGAKAPMRESHEAQAFVWTRRQVNLVRRLAELAGPSLLVALLSILAIVLASGMWTIAAYREDLAPEVGKNAWRSVAGFFPNGVASARELPQSVLNSADLVLWRSWSPETGPVQGRIVSAPFPVTRYLAVPFVGFPDEDAQSFIALRCLQNSSQFRIPLSRANNQWTLAVLDLPDHFCRGDIQLVAQSSGRSNYLGVGTPFSTDSHTYIIYQWELVVPALGILYWLFYAALVVVVSMALPLEWSTPQRFLASTTFAFTVGLAAFAVFHFSPQAGRWLTFTLIGSVLGVLVVAICFWRDRLAAARRMLGSHGLDWLLFSVVAIAFVSGLQRFDGPWSINGVFSPARWSSDNQIPPDFAEALFLNSPRNEIRWGPWLASDRPPLLTGLLLPARVIAEAIGLPGYLAYQAYTAAAIVVLSVWFSILAAIVSDVVAERRLAFVVVLPLLVSPFYLFNTVYIWPKLLAATLGLIGFWALWRSNELLAVDRMKSSRLLTVSALSASLSMLSHTGTSLGLVVFAPLLLRLVRQQNAAMLAKNVVAFLAVQAPWWLWQRFTQPGGNALIRYSLSGDFGFDNRGAPLLNSVLRAYGQLGFAGFIRQKIEYLSILLGNFTSLNRCVLEQIGPRWVFGGDLAMLRAYDLLMPLFAFKFMAAGIALVLWRCRRGKGAMNSVPRFIVHLIGYGLAGVCLAYAIILPCPINPVLPYVSIVMFSLGSYGLMYMAYPRLFFIVVFFDFIYFVLVWFVGPIRFSGGIDYLALMVVILGSLVILMRSITSGDAIPGVRPPATEAR